MMSSLLMIALCTASLLDGHMSSDTHMFVNGAHRNVLKLLPHDTERSADCRCFMSDPCSNKTFAVTNDYLVYS